MRNWLLLLLPALACVPAKPIGPGQACPCADGWVCVVSDQVCVAADAGAPPADAGAPPLDALPPGGENPPAVDGPPAACPDVTYPESGFYAANFLLPEVTDFKSMSLGEKSRYELIAQQAPGTTLTIKMTFIGDAHDAGIFTSGWWLNQGEGWLVSLFDDATGQQTFFSSVARPELEIGFTGQGQARVDYFECGSAVPTRTKMITWGP
jgi:hypothetical protein